MREWFEEWENGVQSEDGKLVEVSMIAEDYDYEYGINLAYLLLNNTSNAAQRK